MKLLGSVIALALQPALADGQAMEAAQSSPSESRPSSSELERLESLLLVSILQKARGDLLARIGIVQNHYADARDRRGETGGWLNAGSSQRWDERVAQAERELSELRMELDTVEAELDRVMESTCSPHHQDKICQALVAIEPRPPFSWDNE